MLMKAVFTVVLLAVAVVLPAWWLFYIGNILSENIIVRIRGEKYIGMCEKYISGRNGGLDVHWNDGKRNHHMIFHVMPIKLRYPHEIKIYSLNNSSNLGLLTIIPNSINFLFFLLVWIICIIGSVDILCNVYKL